ncbi:tonb-dependent receptor [Flammeovirgaceae bacterium 311]|nr:tonb-dependent receptor [Flammeovirgaceae bacterium 311]
MPNAKLYIAHLLLAILLLLGSPVLLQAQQTVVISGRVTEATSGRGLAGADVFVQGTSVVAATDSKGYYTLPSIPYGTYAIAVFHEGLRSVAKSVEAQAAAITVNFALEQMEETLKEVVVERKTEGMGGITRLQAVEGTAIYEAKKSEVILIEGLTANLATNNSRQIYSKVPGLNIWESDGAGIQLGIGGRGLSPNRTANFNTRQNGYDISADALGYPESYYTPPVEGVEKIQIVRGAASLQYGTQFGGMLNFVMKKGPSDKPFEFTSRQTLGSFGLFNSFNSVGGTKGKINYYGFYQYKHGDGWRPNSGFEVNTAFADLNMQLTDKFFLCLEYTHMDYLAQQPGGLTDAQFAQDPRQSFRDRNWFKVDWNLMAVLMEYKFNQHTRLEMKNFGLYASRDALGDLGRIDRPADPNRTLISDQFRNIGSELRLLHRYNLGKQTSVFLAGARAYKGLTYKKQGVSTEGSGPDFRFEDPSNLKSDHQFPNWNVALFAENIFNLSDRLSLTPGIRWEWINTRADGYYQELPLQLQDEFGLPYTVWEKGTDIKNLSRPVLLGGLGLSYKLKDLSELYTNFSQNYRAVTFTDIRTINPNIIVDPNLSDERGYSADLGWRGSNELLNWDVSLFMLAYLDKIGRIPFKEKLLTTNVGRAYITGVESFAEVSILPLVGITSQWQIRTFGNLALIQGQYAESGEKTIAGNDVELVPDINAKAGIRVEKNRFSLSGQYTYLSDQFTDATNSEKGLSSGGVIGPIPAYYVADLSASYEIGKYFKVESGINNLTNNMYFTRRAEGYPGPGIIPSDGRNFYLSLQFKY